MLFRRFRSCLTFKRSALFSISASSASPLFHRDLKSPNVLITNTWQAKVSDFGMAKFDTSAIMSASNSTTSAGKGGLGSTKWKAPELFKFPRPNFNESCDVYSFGIVVWEVLTGLVPYKVVPNEALGGMVRYEKKRPEPMPEGKYGPLVQLMEQCWQQEPGARLTFRAIVDVLTPLQEKRRSGVQRDGSFQRKVKEQAKKEVEEETQKLREELEAEKRLMKAQLEQARREIEEEKRKAKDQAKKELGEERKNEEVRESGRLDVVGMGNFVIFLTNMRVLSSFFYFPDETSDRKEEEGGGGREEEEGGRGEAEEEGG